MVYKLNVTDHADELLDNLVYHLIYRLKSKEAAKHLLDSVESIYDRLVENPYQFPKSRDMYLAKKGYYEAVIPQMNYIVIFDVRKNIVNIVGIFHQLENYLSKLCKLRSNGMPVPLLRNGYSIFNGTKYR